MDLASLTILKSLSLLFVEDDVATRDGLATTLEPFVGQLYVAGDGQEGLALFRDRRPDIVVTDVQMPQLGGLAMSAEIRRLAPEQPIVVLSAYSDVEYLFRAIELGIDHYLTKPVDAARLLDKVAHVANVLVAVREQRRTRELLEQYRRLVDDSAIVCRTDADGRITYVNDKLCEIGGYRPADLVGRSLADLRHSSEPPANVTAALAQLADGRQWTGVVRNRTKDGDLYVVESSQVPIRDEQGSVAEIVVLDVDVTELYATYQNLADALERSHLSIGEREHFLREYKRALEFGTCICVIDRDQHIVSLNNQFETLLGYASAELQGVPLSRIAPGAPPAGDNPYGNGDAPPGRVLDFIGKDGVERQFGVGEVRVRGPADEIESSILVCQDLTESLRLSREIVDAQRELLYVLGEAVENRSEETGQHVRRVAQVSRFLALKAGLTSEAADLIEAVAPMHDVGKVGIRDAVLNKPGKLDADEFEEMKAHSSIGYSILGKIDRHLMTLAATIAHQHHERYDGMGYPDGLKGEQISIEARIVGIADVLDALASSRSYKRAWDEQRIVAYFREQRGRQFDPDLVDLLLTHWDAVQSIRAAADNTVARPASGR